MKQIVLFVVAILVGFSMFAEKKIDDPSDETKKYWEMFSINFAPVQESLKKFVSAKENVVSSLETNIDERKNIDLLKKKLLSKTISDAEKSILEKQINDREAKLDSKVGEFIETYKMPALELMESLREIEEKRKRVGKTDIVKEYERIAKSGQFSHLYKLFGVLDAGCIDKKSFDNKCLKNWVNTCSGVFSTAEGKLAREFIDDSLNLVLKPSDEPQVLFEDDKVSIVEDWYHSAIATGTYACLFLSSQGYNFQKKSLFFKDDNGPEWLRLANEKSNQNFSNIMKFCPPRDIASKVEELLKHNRVADYEKKYNLPNIKKFAEGCDKFVKSVCANVKFVDESEMALIYATQGCDHRGVTKADIEKDVDKFKESSAWTEAEIKSHQMMATVLDSCSDAKKKDYQWVFQLPEFSSECKKKFK
jgi:hypothetical protein